MRITVRHSAKSAGEALRQGRPWWRTVLRASSNIRALIYLVVGLFLGFDFIQKGLRASPPNWHDAGLGLLVLCGVGLLLWLLYWRQTAPVRKALKTQSDQRVELTSAGLTVEDGTGASSFEPWTAFRSFRTTASVLILKREAKGAAARVIPVETLTPAEAGELRSVLLSHLPEA